MVPTLNSYFLSTYDFNILPSTFRVVRIARSRGVSGNEAILIVLIAMLCFQSFLSQGLVMTDDRPQQLTKMNNS